MNQSPDVDAYLAGVPEPHRSLLEDLRAIIRAEAPEAEERLAYGMPGYALDGPLLYFGAFARHCSLFGAGDSVGRAFAGELAGFRQRKGTIQFTADHPLPRDLVARIVHFRVEENRARAAARTTAKKASRSRKPAPGG